MSIEKNNKKIKILKGEIKVLKEQQNKIKNKVFDILIDGVYIPFSIASVYIEPVFENGYMYFFVYLFLKGINKFNQNEKIERINRKIEHKNKKIFMLNNTILETKSKIERNLLYEQYKITAKKEQLNKISDKEKQRAEIRAYKSGLSSQQRSFFDNVDGKVTLHFK